MDPEMERSMDKLKLDLFALEVDRCLFLYNKYAEDEIRLSECIDDILDLHREVFLLPRTGGIMNEHAYSINKPDGLMNMSEDSSKKRFCRKEIPEHSESDSDDFEDESPLIDDNSNDGEYELARNDFMDLIKDKEIEISKLVIILLDKFLRFSRKVADVNDQISNSLNVVLGEYVKQLDELICKIHAKYVETLDML